MDNRDFMFDGNKYSLAWEYSGVHKIYHWELMSRINDTYFPMVRFKTVFNAVSYANKYRAAYYQNIEVTND